MRGELLIFWLVGLAVLAIVAAAAFLSPDARLRRRRRKSNKRIVSRSNRPSVRFSVKTPKE
jgi:hypothetical protein